MARSKAKKSKSSRGTSGSIPSPFKEAPQGLETFYRTLSKKHVYVAHIDHNPWEFKRKIFVVPVLMNVAVVAFFAWRMAYIMPWYVDIFASMMGFSNDTTISSSDLEWSELVWTVGRRALTFMIDLCLIIFVWPWPLEFCFGRNGNPVQWRWRVGFRNKEIYVRRSREWDRHIGDVLKAGDVNHIFFDMIRKATSPMLLSDKTGYLLMNGEWDLDFGAMIQATKLVDDKELAMYAFKLLVLVHHKDYGWLIVVMGDEENSQDSEKRRQVFAFRDALAAVGKEDLFFRWIEIIQFETSQPAGFGPEKQVEVAQQIRDLFQSNGIDFDEFWKESVGTPSSEGL